MSPIVLSVTIVAYFAILFTISYIAGHKADNEGFFVGNHKSAWYIVAFAMIGSTISGVTFVSVPGHGASQQFFLSTNGIGIHRRANYHSVCARPAFLPHELGIHLRIFGEQVRLLVL